ncbi:DUF3325 domain-containing protein [Pelomonas sp. HMWF004]|nr:DUF3325 domain-containing protein [Pelomonas sp. HMWF004]
MLESLLLIAAAASALLGLSWIALGMQVHWHQACVRETVPPRLLKPLGTAALLLSLALCLLADHPSMAVLVWIMLLAVAAVTVAMTLSTRPRWLLKLWPAADR